MKLYTIDKGKHSSGIHIPEFTFNTSISFRARFNHTVLYKTGCMCNQLAVNKLYGFSDSWSFHMRNSARIGWRWNDNRKVIEFIAYVHRSGKIISKYLCDAKVDNIYIFTIIITEKEYGFAVFNVKGDGIAYDTIPRANLRLRGPKYKLFPYFGGKETAPHTITIELEEL